MNKTTSSFLSYLPLDVDSVIAPFLAIKFKNDAYAVKNSRLIANKEWLSVAGTPSNREPEQDADLGGYACDAVMSQVCMMIL